MVPIALAAVKPSGPRPSGSVAARIVATVGSVPCLSFVQTSNTWPAGPIAMSPNVQLRLFDLLPLGERPDLPQTGDRRPRRLHDLVVAPGQPDGALTRDDRRLVDRGALRARFPLLLAAAGLLSTVAFIIIAASLGRGDRFAALRRAGSEHLERPERQPAVRADRNRDRARVPHVEPGHEQVAVHVPRQRGIAARLAERSAAAEGRRVPRRPPSTLRASSIPRPYSRFENSTTWLGSIGSIAIAASDWFPASLVMLTSGTGWPPERTSRSRPPFPARRDRGRGRGGVSTCVRAPSRSRGVVRVYRRARREPGRQRSRAVLAGWAAWT